MRCGPVLILLFIVSSSVQGQQLLFENYSSEQGLSQNSCYTIAQDSDGFMWFGTQDGLNRYDGKQFMTYLPQNSIGKKLPSNYISSLYFDSTENLLWVGTIGGVCLYDPGSRTLLSVSEKFTYATLLESVPIKKIVSFRPHEYWIVTFNRGLLCLNSKSRTVDIYFGDDNNKVRVSSIVQHQGKIIAAVLHHLFTLEPKQGKYTTVPLLPQQQFPEIRELYSYQDALWIGTLTEGCYYLDKAGTVHPFRFNTGGVGCFITDASNNLWIGTRGNGIVHYNPQSQVVQTASHNRYDSRTPGKNFVLSLFRDRQGIVWCGLSGSGIAKYDPLKYQFRTISNEPMNPASLQDNMVFDIYKCKDGTSYVGTQNKGLAEWDPLTNEFHTYSESSRFGSTSNTIHDMTEDDGNNLWIAGWGGLMKLDRKQQRVYFNDEQKLLTARKLYGIIKLKHADSLFITGENGPVFFSLADQQWKPCVNSVLQDSAFIGRYMYEDDNKTIWICTVGGGLVKFDYRAGTFEIIETVRKYSIYVRHLFANGTLFWLATDNGIVVYDHAKNEVVRHITLNAINASNVCYAIQKDKEGFFWVSSNTGLYKIHPKNYSSQNYDLGNGLSFLEYNTACALSEADGTLFFGGVGGITQFNPLQIKGNSFSPSPLVTAMYVNDSLWPAGNNLKTGGITLDHRQNFITIHFAVNNFSNQNKNQFSYRLRGLSNTWTNSGNRNFANYTSLPPGDYVFELRSANSDGIWSNEITSLSFRIDPPWWQTWWFKLAAIVFIAAIVTYIVRRRIGAIRREADLKHKIAETEMMALRAQMNPHFIFNCINSIDGLIQSNDKYQATVYLNKFARLIRNILDSSRQNMVSLSKDLETLQLYIDLEKFRNENKFTSEISAEVSLLEENYKVPPLIIQPYVENAILHGLRKKPGNNGMLKIAITRASEHIEYIIEDNGAGRSAVLTNGHDNGKRSYGMQMSQDRVKLFNQEDQASIQITDLYTNGEPSGTRVRVLLKIQ